MELVEDEWDRDPETEDLENLLYVTYDAASVTPEQMVATIQKEGFLTEIR